MKQYHTKDKLEIGVDEAGRGCLFGPVCVAAVIWPEEEPDITKVIKDSKRLSEKQRNVLREYIEDYAISFSVKMVHNDTIDKIKEINEAYEILYDDERRKIYDIQLMFDKRVNFTDDEIRIIYNYYELTNDHVRLTVRTSMITLPYGGTNYVMTLCY